MKWYWKTAIALFALIVLILILNIGLNFWIKYTLPKVINRENDSAYAITYKDLSVSLLNSNILAKEIIIIPKSALKNTKTKAGIYAKVHSLEVNGFKIWPLVFGDKLKARSITITEPEVTLFKSGDKALSHSKSIRSDVVAPFEKIISVPDISLLRGNFKVIRVQNNKPLLSVQNVNLQLNGLIITDAILEEKIPFHFKDYNLTCDSLYYKAGDFYNVRTKKIKTSKTNLNVAGFTMIPNCSRLNFVKQIPKEKDLYTLRSKNITIKKMEWGFKTTGIFFFHSPVVSLENVAANIYRSKVPPDDPVKRKMYNKMLRDLKIDLKVDTLLMRNSIVEYEEEKSFDKGPGKLSFNKFNLLATHIRSGFEQKHMNDVKIKIRCRFMNASPLVVDWRFNVLDKTDGFNIKGTVLNFDAEKISAFTKPYMNVTTKGILNEVYFNFTGNDKQDYGDFAIKYDDLKFAVYKKNNPEKKNKLITFVANLLVKNDTNNKVKSTKVQLERMPDRSFFNFLWRSIQSGLTKILI